MIRATYFVSGRVQGVGFRYTTQETAKKFDVQGTVENLEDERVKIVVEGESQEIDRFILAVRASMSGQIKHIDRFESAPSREFENFTVRR